MRTRIRLFANFINNNRLFVTGGAAKLLIFVGIILMFKSHALAWPQNFEYVGNTVDTPWGRMETHLTYLAYYLVGLGTALLLTVTYIWLTEARRAHTR